MTAIFNLRLDAAHRADLKFLADVAGRDQSQIIRDLIRFHAADARRRGARLPTPAPTLAPSQPEASPAAAEAAG